MIFFFSNCPEIFRNLTIKATANYQKLSTIKHSNYKMFNNTKIYCKIFFFAYITKFNDTVLNYYISKLFYAFLSQKLSTFLLYSDEKNFEIFLATIKIYSLHTFKKIEARTNPLVILKKILKIK